MIAFLIFVGKCLFVTYCTMTVLFWIFWMVSSFKHFNKSMLDGYNYPVPLKWVRFWSEAIIGTFFVGAAWPIMISVLTLDESERMGNPFGVKYKK